MAHRDRDSHRHPHQCSNFHRNPPSRHYLRRMTTSLQCTNTSCNVSLPTHSPPTHRKDGLGRRVLTLLPASTDNALTFSRKYSKKNQHTKEISNKVQNKMKKHCFSFHPLPCFSLINRPSAPRFPPQHASPDTPTINI